MTNLITWTHFKEITGIIDRINSSIAQLKRDIDKLKSMKEEILDNVEFKTELKKIIDVYPNATIESLVNDYTRFQALKDWLEKNKYI